MEMQERCGLIHRFAAGAREMAASAPAVSGARRWPTGFLFAGEQSAFRCAGLPRCSSFAHGAHRQPGRCAPDPQV